MARKRVTLIEKSVYLFVAIVAFFGLLSSLFKPDTSTIPLKLTESSTIKQDLKSYFCTNKGLYWKRTSPADKNRYTDVRVSYVIVMDDGRKIFINDQNLDIFQFSDSSDYSKLNSESRNCYSIGIDFEQVPSLVYQKGYNRKTQPDLHKKEISERSDFASKVDYILYSFKDKDNKELISFSAKR